MLIKIKDKKLLKIILTLIKFYIELVHVKFIHICRTVDQTSDRLDYDLLLFSVAGILLCHILVSHFTY